MKKENKKTVSLVGVSMLLPIRILLYKPKYLIELLTWLNPSFYTCFLAWIGYMENERTSILVFAIALSIIYLLSADLASDIWEKRNIKLKQEINIKP